LIIEGDMDKLEWIKNNHGIVHFGVIDKFINSSNSKIVEWFKKNYEEIISTQQYFLNLLKFDIANNRQFHTYSNLTFNVLDLYKSKDLFVNPEEFIQYIFEYALKCNNSLIIEWFENNFSNFSQLAQQIPIYKIQEYWKICVHNSYGYQNKNNVHYQPWFDKYIKNNKHNCESLIAKGYWKNTYQLESIILRYMFDSSFDYN
jgi:hypothetical protein